jgi:CRP-like cAMP-binding protein
MAAPSSFEAVLPQQFGPQAFISPPQRPTPLVDIVAALRTIPALDGLTDEEYGWLATHGTEYAGDDGAMVFAEGSPCDSMVFILKGEVHVRRHNGGPMALWIGRAGQMTGRLPYSRMKNYGGDGYTVGPSWSLQIHESRFPEMLAAIPSMTQRCVSTMMDRVREVTRMEQQAEKLDALGKLAANLAHELNNPASAAQRSASSLFSACRTRSPRSTARGSSTSEPSWPSATPRGAQPTSLQKAIAKPI